MYIENICDALNARYHPDVNKGSKVAQQRFHIIKDAFENVKAQHGAHGETRTHSGRYGRDTHMHARHPYGSASGSRKSESSFHGFRRDGRPQADFNAGYREENTAHQRRRGTTHESMHIFRSRFRLIERMGIGIGVACVSMTIAAGTLGSGYFFKVQNRGKSFDDLMKTLDARSFSEESVKRRRRILPKKERKEK